MSWTELAKSHPFKETAERKLEPPSIQEVAGLDNRVIISTDGRRIPCFVDQSSRSVYPVRESK